MGDDMERQIRCRMKQNKIIPSLWFCSDNGNISGIIDYYKNVFGNDLEVGSIMPLGNTPSGYAEMCEVTVFGYKYLWMSTEKEHHPLNDAVSFIINCEDQMEIDKYWNYFTLDGRESQCGWCNDKYGVRWQVLPKNFGELMGKPNAGKVMMTQTKIIIAEYLQ